MQEAFELAAQKKAEQKIEEMVKIVQQVENSFETQTTETTTSTASKKDNMNHINIPPNNKQKYRKSKNVTLIQYLIQNNKHKIKIWNY